VDGALAELAHAVDDLGTHIVTLDAAPPPAAGVTWWSLTTANARRLFPRLTR
jgi:hypothetical protein